MAALACLMERILRSQKLGDAVNESETLACEERGRTVLAIQAREFGLMFKKFQLARRAGHVEINHASRFGSELRRQDGEWVGSVPSEIESSL